jgi:tetratricopeptide (TPR) repeat protein
VLGEYDDPDLDADAKEHRITGALFGEKDGARAAQLKKETYPDGWEEDPILLNSFAWWCFENGFNLEEAEDLARKAIGLIEPGEDQANIMDTLAEIRNARGDTEGALSWIENALRLHPKNRYLRGQRKRFQALLEE